MAESLSLDFPLIKRDLLRSRHECALRGLRQSAKWASELAYALRDIEACPPDLAPAAAARDDDLDDTYYLAKSYLDLNEYDRVAYFTKNATGTTRFLHYYARYLSDEKKRLDDTVEPIMATGPWGEPRAEGSTGVCVCVCVYVWLVGLYRETRAKR
ncbi:hypothetical protein HPB49_013177 [Dermacentor silvarum]|uniref:Uncharacterized protein n=1 Tax=Dermacentor silvarum TaxID=543639 RepID=A0ACB8C3V0_DERSI|nr:hypothetical protein HPB49_013177 [Dermacentor silvarum]